MSTQYIPANEAGPMSEKLWALARPPEAASAEVTTQMFPVVQALDNSLWLAVDTDFEITVHPQAELDGIVDILQPFVGNSLSADVLQQLADLVVSKRGQPLIVYDAFPQFFKDQGKSFAQMVEFKLLKPNAP